MTQTLAYDVDAIGSGSNGFGNMNNPLLWLITLGFLGGGNGLGFGRSNEGAGVLAGETQAKLDCLGQQHATLMSQIAKNDTDANFVTLGQAVAETASVQRDTTAAITAQNNDLSRQIADCCCNVRESIQGVRTDIALQTNTLTMNANENTQKILDRMCANEVAAVQAENNKLATQLSEARIIAALGSNGGHGHGANS